MFTNEEIRRIAMEQSAEDIGCSAGDFLKPESVVVDFRLGERAKVYYSEPIACNFVSYGGNVVAAAVPQVKDCVAEYVRRHEYYHLIETPNCLWLNEKLSEFGQKICFMAYYFLPDMNKLRRLDCRYKTKLLTPENFQSLYTKEWSNALCAKRKECDMLCYGAYDGERLIGLAGCSADCDSMWQIGVDVLGDLHGVFRAGLAFVDGKLKLRLAHADQRELRNNEERVHKQKYDDQGKTYCDGHEVFGSFGACFVFDCVCVTVLLSQFGAAPRNSVAQRLHFGRPARHVCTFAPFSALSVFSALKLEPTTRHFANGASR